MDEKCILHADGDYFSIQTADGKIDIPVRDVAGICMPPCIDASDTTHGHTFYPNILQKFPKAARFTKVDGTVVWSIGDRDWYKECKHCGGGR